MASRIRVKLAAVMTGAVSLAAAGVAFGQTEPVQEWWRITDVPGYTSPDNGAITDSGGDIDMITHAFYPDTGAARWASPQIYDGGAGDDVGKKIAIDDKNVSTPCFVKKPIATGDTFNSTTDFNFRTIRFAECDTNCFGPCP